MHLTKQQFELAIPILVQKDLTQVKCPWSSKAHYYKHTTTSTSGIITNTTTNTTTTNTNNTITNVTTKTENKIIANTSHLFANT